MNFFEDNIRKFERELESRSEPAIKRWLNALTTVIIYGEALDGCVEKELVTFSETSLFMREALKNSTEEFKEGINVFNYKLYGKSGDEKSIGIFSPTHIIIPSREDAPIAFSDVKTIYMFAKPLYDACFAAMGNEGFSKVRWLLDNVLKELHLVIQYGGVQTIGLDSLFPIDDYAPCTLTIDGTTWDNEKIFTKRIVLFKLIAVYPGCYGKHAVKKCDIKEDEYVVHLSPYAFKDKWDGAKEAYSAFYPIMPKFVDILSLGKKLMSENNGIYMNAVFKNEELIKVEVAVEVIHSSKKMVVKKNFYMAMGECVIKECPPPAAVWPKKIDLDGVWKTYWLYQKDTLESGMFYVTPHEESVSEHGDYSVSRIDGFPYLLHLKDGGKLNAIDCGFVAIKPGGFLPRNRREIGYLGFDFGTINSMAVLGFENEDSNIAETDTLDFTQNDEWAIIYANEVNKSLYKGFIHSIDRNANKPWFYTLLHLSEKATLTTVEELNALNEIEDAHIMSADFTHRKSPVKGNVETKVKWSEKTHTSNVVRMFVRQIVYMCLYKAFEKEAGFVYFRMAYPISIGDVKVYIDNLKNFVKEAADRVLKSGWDEKKKAKTSFCQLCTESYASAVFVNFATPMANMKNGIGVIDIGGGSTDFALIVNQDNNIVPYNIPQSSIAFAGKKALTNRIHTSILSKQNMFKEMFPNLAEAMNIFENKPEKDKEPLFKTEILIEIFLEEKIDSEIKAVKKDSDIFKKMRRLIYFTVAGQLYFFAEYVIRRTDFRPGEGFTIAFCGNGSKILWWLEKEEIEILKNLFFKFLYHERLGGVPQKTTVEFFIPDRPKLSVAEGLTKLIKMDFRENEPQQRFMGDKLVDAEDGFPKKQETEIDEFCRSTKRFIEMAVLAYGINKEKCIWSTVKNGDMTDLTTDLVKRVNDFVINKLSKAQKEICSADAFVFVLEEINRYLAEKFDMEDN